MESEIFQMILQAKAETAAAFGQVTAEMGAMVHELQAQTQVANASLAELGMQTRQLEQVMSQTAVASGTHGKSIGTSFKASMADVGVAFAAVETDIARLSGTLMNATFMAL